MFRRVAEWGWGASGPSGGAAHALHSWEGGGGDETTVLPRVGGRADRLPRGLGRVRRRADAGRRGPWRGAAFAWRGEARRATAARPVAGNRAEQGGSRADAVALWHAGAGRARR